MSGNISRYTDEQLFEAFRTEGKEKQAAFRELYSRYEQKVYVYCIRMTGNTEDASDMFQETFTRFFKYAAREIRLKSVVAYLITIARNVFLNSLRNKVPTTTLDENDLTAQLPLYERRELLNMVGSALDLLEPQYREAFVLRFYESLSYREIAEITGDSVSSLKVRVMRAKDQVRTILSPYIKDLANSNKQSTN